MRLAFSNIAWDVHEDEAVAELLRTLSIDAIDIAPGKYFPDPPAATEAQILAVRHWWSDRGFEITGMQSLLFGTSGLNMFGPQSVQDAMIRHLQAVCRIGRLLGATRLVFGSPRNRDRSGILDEDALRIAISFFRRFGDIASNERVVVCLEPNPREYGANFMTTTTETAEVVAAVAHPAIRMQLDSGALAMNGEDAEAMLSSFADRIGHVHASEPQLMPLGDGSTPHGDVHEALMRHLPAALVSIEMVATADEPHLESIARAAAVAVRHYRTKESTN